jgi:hypothetical protein
MGYTKEGSMDIWGAWDAVIFIYGYKWWGRRGTFALVYFAQILNSWLLRERSLLHSL